MNINLVFLFRSPFEGLETYDQLKSELVEISIKLATIGQRDQFAEDQATVIRDNCLTLSEMADQIIQVATLLQSLPLI